MTITKTDLKKRYPMIRAGSITKIRGQSWVVCINNRFYFISYLTIVGIFYGGRWLIDSRKYSSSTTRQINELLKRENLLKRATCSSKQISEVISSGEFDAMLGNLCQFYKITK